MAWPAQIVINFNVACTSGRATVVTTISPTICFKRVSSGEFANLGPNILNLTSLLLVQVPQIKHLELDIVLNYVKTIALIRLFSVFTYHFSTCCMGTTWPLSNTTFTLTSEICTAHCDWSTLTSFTGTN